MRTGPSLGGFRQAAKGRDRGGPAPAEVRGHSAGPAGCTRVRAWSRERLPTGWVTRSWYLSYVHVCLWTRAGTHGIFRLLPQSKRKDSEPRTKCLLNNADLAPHHPKDPVEMRRINFQTPGT